VAICDLVWEVTPVNGQDEHSVGELLLDADVTTPARS